MTGHTDDRLRLAEAFLQEAVFRSRDAQAGAGVLRPGVGNCGLGDAAAVELDLSERGRALSDELFGATLSAERTRHVHAVMTRWIERQDALDRDRNHFLRDFRKTHGFDRAEYTDEQAAAYREGLDRVNDSIARERAAAARELLESD